MKIIKLKRNRTAESFVAGFLIASLGFMNYQMYFANRNNPEYKLNKIIELMDKEYIEDFDKDDFVEYVYELGLTYFNDPFTMYFPKQDYENFNNSINGVYSGVGIEIKDKSIANVFDSTPASRAGLKSGDIILKINDKIIETNEDITNIISNSDTEKFIFIVKRESEKLTFEVKKERIVIPVIETKSEEIKVNKNIGYIRIKQFNHRSFVDLRKSLESYSDKKGIIIDLRDNLGGYLDEAEKILQYFCSENEVIFYEKTKETLIPYYGKFNKTNIPIVILVNEYTASASEVVAAGLQENNKAVIIGTKTYGKGVYQSTFNFTDGSGIKITSGEWLTPSKSQINKLGITPDYEIDNIEEQIKKAEEIIFGK